MKVKKSMRGCFLVGVYLYIILKVVRISFFKKKEKKMVLRIILSHYSNNKNSVGTCRWVVRWFRFK